MTDMEHDMNKTKMWQRQDQIVTQCYTVLLCLKKKKKNIFRII